MGFLCGGTCILEKAEMLVILSLEGMIVYHNYFCSFGEKGV